MIIFTREGVYSDFGNMDALNKVMEAAEEAVKKEGRITIKELYRDYLKIGMGYLQPDYDPAFEPDLFVDEECWGWDKKGYRQIYEIVTMKLPLN